MLITKLSAERERFMDVPISNGDGTFHTERRRVWGQQLCETCTAWLSDDEMDWLASTTEKRTFAVNFEDRTFTLHCVCILSRGPCEGLTHCELMVDRAIPLELPVLSADVCTELTSPGTHD